MKQNSVMENKKDDFEIVFKMLEKAKEEQKEKAQISESDYVEIQDGIKAIQEIQQSVDSETYTMFTRA